VQKGAISFVRNRIKNVNKRDSSLLFCPADITERCIFTFILEKCDLSALKSISLSTSSESWDRRTYKRLKSLAVLTKSIPLEVFEKTSSHTTDDFQLCVADLSGKRASALESLTITNNTDDLRMELLTSCSKTLKRMELLTSCSKTLKELDLFGEYKGGKDLELVIPKMSFLRKLNAKFCDGITAINQHMFKFA
jgi:hypothetical protein